MEDSKYSHLSLVRYRNKEDSCIILVTQRELSLDNKWLYSGKILDISDPMYPIFKGNLENIPENELSSLEKKVSTRIINMNPAV
jgi:hypothetical protein